MKTWVCLTGAIAVGALVSTVACSSDNSADPAPTPDAGVPTPPDGGTDASVVIDCPAPTAGPTVHKGDIQGEETWTAAGSPHILDANVNVRNGAKLTIEPCAEVQLAQDVRLAVAYPLTPNTGTLIAEGTATRPIRFKGKDGARWANLYVNAPGTARLAYVTFEGGGSTDGTDDGTTINALGDSVLPADPILSIDHVTIKGSAGTGLWMTRGATFTPGSNTLVVTGSGSDKSPYPVRVE